MVLILDAGLREGGLQSRCVRPRVLAAANAAPLAHVEDTLHFRRTAQRGNAPNFVAVDFSTIGGLTDAVDELNGVRSAR